MSRPWMPLYSGDYRADTAHLTAAEHGAYLLLIMHYWDHGSLPDDDARLARIAACSHEEWMAMRPTIRAFFHDGWKHKRIDSEMAKSLERSKAGKRGGRPKAKVKQNESKPESKTEALQPHPQKERGGDARARAVDPKPERGSSLISPEAHCLADECLRSIGIEPADEAKAPEGLCGLRYNAEIWAARGHDPPIVVATFARHAKRGKPMSYIAKAVETAVAERATVPPSLELPLLTTVGGGRNAQTDRRATRAGDGLSFAGYAAALRARPAG